MLKNNQYRTEVFGGTNPVFVPYFTDEKEYEDLKNNIHHLREKKLCGLKTAQPSSNFDVDFDNNLNDGRLGQKENKEGYGTFKKNYEGD